MTSGINPIFSGVSSGLEFVLEIYYEYADHRQSEDGIPANDNGIFRQGIEAIVYHLPGMFEFEVAPIFRDAYRREGFDLRSLAPTGLNLLAQWPVKTRQLADYFLNTPKPLDLEVIPEDFLGHSAGGYSEYIFGLMRAMAMIEDMEGLEDFEKVRAIDRLYRGILLLVPELKEFSPGDFLVLGRRFLNSLLSVAGAPLNGIALTILGEIVHLILTALGREDLLGSMLKRTVNPIYDKIGLRPDHVIDIVFLSKVAPLDNFPTYGSLALAALLQLGLRLASPFKVRESEKGHDAIVRVEEALLHGPDIVFQNHDHLRMVESPEAAREQIIAMRNRRKKGPRLLTPAMVRTYLL